MPPRGSHMAPKVPPTDVPITPAGAQQKAHTLGIADLELPKTSLVKLAKGSIPDNVKMQQDVVLALLRSSTLFISYLTAAAHDQATSRSGKSITASDVIKAITEMDFGPSDALVPLLEQELAAYRANALAVKASKMKPPGPGRGRRRKSAVDDDGAADTSMGGDDGEQGEDDDDGEDDEDGDEEEVGDDEGDTGELGAEEEGEDEA